MKKIDTPLVFEGKGNKNKLPNRGKMFGYQVLGFGAGGKVSPPIDVDYLVVQAGFKPKAAKSLIESYGYTCTSFDKNYLCEKPLPSPI